MMKKKHYTWEAFEVDGVAFLSSKNPTKLLHTKGCSYGEKKYGHKTREGFSCHRWKSELVAYPVEMFFIQKSATEYFARVLRLKELTDLRYP